MAVTDQRYAPIHPPDSSTCVAVILNPAHYSTGPSITSRMPKKKKKKKKKPTHEQINKQKANEKQTFIYASRTSNSH